MNHTIRFFFLSLTLASPSLYAEGERTEGGSTAVATHTGTQVSQHSQGHSTAEVPHSGGSSGAIVPHQAYEKIDKFELSKSGTVKGHKSRVWGQKRRHLIKGYQEAWNKQGKQGLRDFLATKNKKGKPVYSDKDRQAVLDHAKKHKGKNGFREIANLQLSDLK